MCFKSTHPPSSRSTSNLNEIYILSAASTIVVISPDSNKAPAEERRSPKTMPAFPPKVPQDPSSGNPSDRILLCGLGGFGKLVASSSPFCTKLETYLRFQGLDYDS